MEERVGWVEGLLQRTGLQLRELGILEIEYAGIPASIGCITAAALAWGPDLDGGLILALPRGEVIPFGPYRDAREPVAAGAHRVGFRYTIRNAGVIESRFHILCVFSGNDWVDCLDVMTDRTVHVNADRLSDADYLAMRADHRAVASISGDSVLIRNGAVYQRLDGEPTAVQLGPLVIRLPPIQ